MKKILIILTVAIVAACSNYGSKVVYDGTEVYYQDEALKEKAEAVGKYLKEIEFTDGSAKSVQITKDSIYNFRMVTQEGLEIDSAMEMSFQALGFLLSREVFDNEAINFQLCDNTFNTIRNIYIEKNEVATQQ